jgi:hypothetical protein
VAEPVVDCIGGSIEMPTPSFGDRFLIENMNRGLTLITVIPHSVGQSRLQL